MGHDRWSNIWEAGLLHSLLHMYDTKYTETAFLFNGATLSTPQAMIIEEKNDPCPTPLTPPSLYLITILAEPDKRVLVDVI